MSRVGFDDLYFTLLAQKLSRAFGIAIAAPHGVSLARQQLCQQRAGAAHTQNEDPHRLGTLPHPTSVRLPATLLPPGKNRNLAWCSGTVGDMRARAVYWPLRLSSTRLRLGVCDLSKGVNAARRHIRTPNNRFATF